MGTNPKNLPKGGGGPQKALLQKIAAAHQELAALFHELATLTPGGVGSVDAGEAPVAKRKD